MESSRLPVCTVCNTSLTVEHILINCDKYKNERKNIFKDHFLNGKKPTLKSLLAESDIFSIGALMHFLKEIDLLDKI